MAEIEGGKNVGRVEILNVAQFRELFIGEKEQGTSKQLVETQEDQTLETGHL